MKLPYAHVAFTRSGTPAHPEQQAEALALLDRVGATDALLLVHGWNNDIPAAERMYAALADRVADLLPPGSASVAVIGVLWPSVRWADADDIAGGGVAVGEAESALAAAIGQSVEDPDLAAQLLALTGRLDTTQGRAEFLAAARQLLPDEHAAATDDEDPVPAPLRDGDADAVFDAVRIAAADAGEDPLVGQAPPVAGGAPGVAPDLLAEGTAGVGLFGLSWPALGQQILNTATYYTMKARAGDVGARGVAPLVDAINAAAPQRRVHLAGHSFGARVAAAAATSITTPIESLTLLQGAFSHYGFTRDFARSGRDGAFVGALGNGLIHGPVVITHTHNDRAVRLAYAIASRLAGQAGAGVGDRSDLYGGIGANGSLGAAATELTLGDAATTYAFQAGGVHNLRADSTVTGHSDVTNAAVANALAQAMGLR